MVSLSCSFKFERTVHHRMLPVMMRQLMVDLKADYLAFTDGEIVAGGAPLSSHSVHAQHWAISTIACYTELAW